MDRSRRTGAFIGALRKTASATYNPRQIGPSGNPGGFGLGGPKIVSNPTPSAGGGSRFLRSADRFGARAMNQGSRLINHIGSKPGRYMLGAGAALGTYAAYRGVKGLIGAARGKKDE